MTRREGRRFVEEAAYVKGYEAREQPNIQRPLRCFHRWVPPELRKRTSIALGEV